MPVDTHPASNTYWHCALVGGEPSPESTSFPLAKQSETLTLRHDTIHGSRAARLCSWWLCLGTRLASAQLAPRARSRCCHLVSLKRGNVAALELKLMVVDVGNDALSTVGPSLQSL